MKYNYLKKVTLFFSLFTLYILNTNAQKNKKISFDLSFTPLGASSVSQKSDAGDKITTKAKFTYGLGVDVNIVIKDDFKFILRPSIASMGYRGSLSSTKNRVQYIVVPALFEFLIRDGGFKLFNKGELIGRGKNKKVVGGIGVYGASALFGKYQLTNGEKKSFKFGESATDNRSALDYGLVLQYGIINPETDLKFMLQARFGLDNVIPDARVIGKSSIKTSSFNWSISIPLLKLKK